MKTDDLKLLVKTVATRKQVSEVVAVVKQKSSAVNELINLTFDQDQQIGFHAAWVLDHLLQYNPVLILENLDELMLRLPHVFNQSCKRHYARILMHATSSKAISELKIKLNSTDLEPLVEVCFDWLIDLKTAVAVKASCCQILFNLSKRYDWIGNELAHEVEFLMKNGSAAIQSKGKQILKDLQK